MLRFWIPCLGLAVAAVACSAARDDAASSTSNATETVPLHCEGLAGIKKLKLRTDRELVGLAGGRAYLHAKATKGAASSCVSVKLDGTDEKACPAPNAETVASKLVAQDGDRLYFAGDGTTQKTLFAVQADGTSTVIAEGEGVAGARLVGDVMVWSTGAEVWSVPKTGGDKTKLYTADGPIHAWATNGDELALAGKGGVRLMKTTDAFRSVGEPEAQPLPGSDTAEVDEVGLTDKSLLTRQDNNFWRIDRATDVPSLLFPFINDSVKVHGFEPRGEAVNAYIENKDGEKVTYYFAELERGSARGLIMGNVRISNVSVVGGAVIWSLQDKDPKFEQFFTAPSKDFGAITRPIQCSNLPLAAPADAGSAPDPDRDRDATAPIETTEDAGTKKKDAGVKAPPVTDDDDVATDSDPTEPEDARDEGAPEAPTSVKINSACQAMPGPVSSGSLAGVVGLGLVVSALSRRRRR